MRIKGSALIVASALLVGHVPLVGHVLLDVALYAQTPAPPSRPAPVVVPQGTPPPPRPAGSRAPASAPAIAPRAPKPGEVESDPIRCWWKADRTSVRVGEKFGLVLTCSVIETGPITAPISTAMR